MKTLTPRQLQLTAWLLSATVVIVAIAAWYRGYAVSLGEVSIYQFFPVFGLIAFSLMWSHYIAAALRVHTELDKEVLHDYFEATSAIVLFAILLHPGLISWQLWKDGFGLPPGSELTYVGPMLAAYIIIAIISLCVFLVYELRRIFADRPWWKYVSFASDGAMILIFFHALKLGGLLQKGWFQKLWWFYGVTLIGSMGYIYTQKYRHPTVDK